MKKLFSFLLLMVAIVAMPTVLTSCGDGAMETIETPNPEPDPEPEEDKFENLYGYWINSDYSGAMEILEYSSDKCKILYFVYTSEGLKTNESYYRGGSSDFFGALTPNGKNVTVEVLSSSLNKLVLEDAPGQGNHLSSYVFSRVDESKFYEYLEGKNSGNGGDNNEQEDDAKTLIGTWVGYDGTPGLDWTDKYTITFYSSGKATEVCSYSGGSESTSGTYKYSNGKITEWKMEDGSALANTLGDPSDSPWTVTFITSTEITIGDKYYSITFNKQ